MMQDESGAHFHFTSTALPSSPSLGTPKYTDYNSNSVEFGGTPSRFFPLRSIPGIDFDTRWELGWLLARVPRSLAQIDQKMGWKDRNVHF